jgi:hypothetical protein
VGLRLEMVGSWRSVGASMVFFRLSRILGAEVVDAQDDSWRGSFMKWLYLVSTPSHVGVTWTV